MAAQELLQNISVPDRLWSRSEVLRQSCPVPQVSGAYGWFFQETPPGVPTETCTQFEGLWLLYVGISPKPPPRNGGRPSSQNLRRRIRSHFHGNASGSTLRLTLGVLLSERLGVELRRMGSGSRMTFQSEGEARLSEWLDRNAFVAWAEHPEPWVIEDLAMHSLSLPLNIQGNARHPFYPELKSLRDSARSEARNKAVVPSNT
jgi:hypothetical protein